MPNVHLLLWQGSSFLISSHGSDPDHYRGQAHGGSALDVEWLLRDISRYIHQSAMVLGSVGNLLQYVHSPDSLQGELVFMACHDYGLLSQLATHGHRLRLDHEYDRVRRGDLGRDDDVLGALECSQRILPINQRRPYVPICHHRMVQNYHDSDNSHQYRLCFQWFYLKSRVRYANLYSQKHLGFR